MAGYHPFLFFLIAAVGAAELGLTAYLVHDYETRSSGYPSDRFRSLIIFILFNASWTVLFGFAYLLFIVGGALHALARYVSSSFHLYTYSDVLLLLALLHLPFGSSSLLSYGV